MSTLSDFFGDSETAEKECLYCGGNDGELVVAVEDANGPTHWQHAECKAEADAKHAEEIAKREREQQMREWIAETDG
jgi:hypothetical protein